jgi:hypothetical protein
MSLMPDCRLFLKASKEFFPAISAPNLTSSPADAVETGKTAAEERLKEKLKIAGTELPDATTYSASSLSHLWIFTSLMT